MVHARVSYKYIHSALIYRTQNTYTVLIIKHLVKQDGEPTTPHKLVAGTKPFVSNLCIQFCLCNLEKATAHVNGKALNMSHQPQKGFGSIFVGIPQQQKVYLIYVPITLKIVSPYDIVFDESKSSALACTSPTYS